MHSCYKQCVFAMIAMSLCSSNSMLNTFLFIISNVMQNDNLSVALQSLQSDIVFEMISISLFKTIHMINTFVHSCLS